MRTLELPSLDTVKKFNRDAAAPAATAVPIKKDGTPIDTEGAFRSVWMDVTPAIAAGWLKNNFRNRPVKDDVVSAYARDMRAGVWRATHQGIAFNDLDALIDGQHRLLAIVKSGCTIRMMVTFGLPSKIEGSEMTTMDCVDRGCTRSVADQLKIQHGLKNGTAISQIASGIAGLCYERVRRLSVGQTLDIYRTFRPGIDFIIEHRSKQTGLKSAGVCAAFAFVMANEDCMVDLDGKCREMFLVLMGEAPEPPAGTYPAIKLLRGKLTSEEAKLLLSSANRGIAELTVQVIWLELTGQRVARLEFSLDGVNHFRGTQPERVAKIAAMFKLPELRSAGVPPAGAEGVPPAAETGGETPPKPAAGDGRATLKARPTVDTLLTKVETRFGISRFILTGKGRDADIDSARVVFIYLARSVGHTAGVTAAALHRTEEQIRDLTLPLAALSAKQKKIVATIQGKP